MSAVPHQLLRHLGALTRRSLALVAVVGALLISVVALPASAAPAIEMVSTGTGEKVQLRFKPKVGTTQTVDFVMSMRMKMTGLMPMDMELPGMKLSMRTTVTNVADNGDITYSLEVIDAGVEGEADPMMKSQMEAQMKAMVGTKAVVVSDDRGNTKSADFTAPPGAPPEIVANLQKSMDGSSANLPEEAVGVGAQWKLSQNIEENGISVAQVTVYEVTKLSAEGVTLSVDVKQSAKTGPMNDPNLPPGATATMKKFQGTGKGTSNFRFDQPMVVNADITVNVESSVEMSMQGQTQTMDMMMGMTTVIRPR